MIHPTAIVDSAARLAEGVEVGPYSVIGPDVEVGEGTTIGPHTVLRGPTRIGRDNRIFQFSSIGEDPQDKKYRGERTRLEIGDRNCIRELVTINRGTAQDRGVTSIGNDNLLMAYVHVAHDCRIADNVIMANAASLAGHVEIQDWAILGGFTIVHQFCRIGAHSFSAMGSVLTKDVPPYVIVGGHPAGPRGINSEGLRRRGFSDESVAVIKRAYRILYLAGLKLDEARRQLDLLAQDSPEVGTLAGFLGQDGRSIVR